MSNTSSLLFSLPVIFVLDRWGEGSDVFVWVFLKGHALIHSRKWEGHDFFRKKIRKYPGPPTSIKNVPSLTNIGVLYSTALDFQTANYIPNMGRKWSSARVNSPHCRQQMIPSGKREWLGLKLQNHGVQFIITTKSSRIHFASQKIRKSL